MEFKAEVVNGKVVVKPNIEKKKNSQGGTDVTVHVPSFKVMEQAKRDLGKGMIKSIVKEVIVELEKDGKRDIQSV